MVYVKHIIFLILTLKGFSAEGNNSIDLLIVVQEEGALELVKYLIQKNYTNVAIFKIDTIPKQEAINELCALPRPKLILDLTTWNMASENVKKIARIAEIPTITTSIGGEGDFLEWLTLKNRHEYMFLQIKQPADLIPYVVRAIVKEHKCDNAGIFYDSTFVMHHKLKSLLLNMDVRHSITNYTQRSFMYLLDYKMLNFFVIGKKAMISSVLADACKYSLLQQTMAWYAVTMEEDGEDVQLNCPHANAPRFILATPKFTKGKLVVNFESLQDNPLPRLTREFYHDIIQMGLHMYPTMKESNLTNLCSNGSEEYLNRYIKPLITNVFRKNAEVPFLVNAFHIHELWNSSVHVEMEVNGFTVNEKGEQVQEHLADWSTEELETLSDVKNMDKYKAVKLYRIAIAVQEPFIFPDPNSERGYSGFCIDLIEEISLKLDFQYILYRPNGSGFRYDFDAVRDDVIGGYRADIALGSLSVDHKVLGTIEYTIPFYELVGIQIMMKIPESSKSIFKIIEVLNSGVWGMLLVLYFITSFLLWLYDKCSPYSYQNNKEAIPATDATRVFTAKECLWFSLTSLTSQGGGEVPRQLSGKIVAGLWWFFGFLTVASYTANLAAFLTASHLEMSIESLEDLSRQYRVKYGFVNGSRAHRYFEDLLYVEKLFYNIKENNNKPGTLDYLIDNMYSRMLKFMEDTGTTSYTLEEAIAKVQASTSSNKFAYIGEATDIQFATMTNCDLQAIGEEFGKRYYGIGLREKSPLKEPMNNALIELLNEGKLEKLRNKWWRDNPKVAKCSDQIEGITIQNAVGVFLLIGGGVMVSMMIMALENAYENRKAKKATRNMVKQNVFNIPTRTQ